MALPDDEFPCPKPLDFNWDMSHLVALMCGLEANFIRKFDVVARLASHKPVPFLDTIKLGDPNFNPAYAYVPRCLLDILAMMTPKSAPKAALLLNQLRDVE